jgi:hypothetical protein
MFSHQDPASLGMQVSDIRHKSADLQLFAQVINLMRGGLSQEINALKAFRDILNL